MTKKFTIIPPSFEELLEAELNSSKNYKERICQLCGVGFRHGGSHSRVCNLCKITTSCAYCGQRFETDWNSFHSEYRIRLIESVKSGMFDMPMYCSARCGGLSALLRE